MRRPMQAFGVALSACLLAAVVGGPVGAEEKVLLSLPKFGPEPSHRIESVDAAKRQARVATVGETFFFQSSEGLALLIVPGADGALDSVVRVEVTEVLDDGSVLVSYGPGAAAAMRKGPALLGRPFGGDLTPVGPPKPATTKALRSLPDFIGPIPGEDPQAGPHVVERPGVDPAQAARAAARRKQSMDNLKHIAFAFHNYEQAMGRFPPPAVIGPDGRPWHSWRVLLLPYLERDDLYEKYDFSQPWDSPKNRPLADEVVKVYRDPARPGDDAFADYAAIVGAHCMFPPGLVTMENADDFPACLGRGKKVSFPQVTDGTSNTIMFATLDPSRKIPWTKPEDIVVEGAFAGIGAADGIGAIHSSGDVRLCLVAFGDGSVQSIADAVEAETMLPLLTRDGGELVDRTQLDVPGSPQPQTGPPMVKIVAGDHGKLRVEVD